MQTRADYCGALCAVARSSLGDTSVSMDGMLEKLLGALEKVSDEQQDVVFTDIQERAEDMPGPVKELLPFVQTLEEMLSGLVEQNNERKETKKAEARAATAEAKSSEGSGRGHQSQSKSAEVDEGKATEGKEDKYYDEEDEDDEDEEDDEGEDYGSLGSDFNWDEDEDDENIAIMNMSADLLAALGLGDAQEAATSEDIDWVPPQASGLDNSARLLK